MHCETSVDKETLKKNLRRMYEGNEATEKDWYKFTPPSKDKSGWSFGQPQWDAGSNNADAQRILNDLGFGGEDIGLLSGGGSIDPAKLGDLNKQLRDNAEKINQEFEKKLDNDAQLIDDIANELEKAGHTANANAIRNSLEMQLRLLDYNNQFNIQGIDKAGTEAIDGPMMDFLKGRLARPDTRPGGIEVQIDGDLDPSDLKRLVGVTKHGQEYPGDVERRSRNIDTTMQKHELECPEAEIPPSISDNIAGAENFIRRRDPLTFDLDGDGIETVGINPANPILFDHDGDGLKTATGWVAPDDAFLVLDRDGNGTIDSGRELFGDSTPLNAGDNAVDGFAALADQDTNADGVVNSADTNFAALRLWRDLNQDGVSQANELFTLPASGIAAIHVGKVENNTLLPNGNVIADLGAYTRTDGTTGGLGAATGQLGDVDLREDTFHSQFTDAIPLTPEAAVLPDMHGSGQVRDLQEAASLSPDFANLLTTYANAPTRAEQLVQLDALLKGWSNTSAMPTTATGAYGTRPLTIVFEGIAEGSPAYAAWLEKLSVLERFNGRLLNRIFCKMQNIRRNETSWPLAA